MKRFFVALFPILLISCFSMTAVAQYTNQPPPYGDFPATKFPDDHYSDRSAPRRNYPWLTPEARVIKDGPLAPSREDRMALQPFLRERNTGLMRLLPREGPKTAADPLKEQVNLRGGGAYYSFAFLTHFYGYGSDIELSHDKLSVGFAGADYGLLLNLGDQPLEMITLEDPRVHSLASYTPPQPEPEARLEYRRLSSKEGLTLDGQLYRSALPVTESSTYLLRSISHSRSDVLVVFRVIRRDDDGSVVIGWKLLKQYSPPKLESGH